LRGHAETLLPEGDGKDKKTTNKKQENNLGRLLKTSLEVPTLKKKGHAPIRVNVKLAEKAGKENTSYACGA